MTKFSEENPIAQFAVTTPGKHLSKCGAKWKNFIVGFTTCRAKQTRGVSHCGLAIYIKMYLSAKEELWKLKYFTMQKYNFQKIL
jgi:hypothetical protein